MTRRSAVLLSRLFFTVCLLVPGAASEADACNFQGTAAASVTAYDGGVVSDHFGQVTNVDCTVHSRYMRLRSNTLENNQQVWVNVKDGDKALMSASIFDSIGFPTCSGQWSSGTKFGTTYLGVLVAWLDSDVSGLTQGYCVPDGGGGGGGGIGECSVASAETTTTVLSEAGVSTGSGDEEQRIGLTRVSERSDGRYIQEEWALLSTDTGELRPEFTSSERYLDSVEENLDRYRSAARRGSNVLVVESADHLMNHRHIPPPGLAPLEIPVDWPGRTGRQEFWCRIEIAETGEVDRILLLDTTDQAGNSAVRSALRERLKLQYADDERHRTVVFGRAIVTPSARLIVQDSLVIVPRCCCYSGETGIWCP